MGAGFGSGDPRIDIVRLGSPHLFVSVNELREYEVESPCEIA